jgi:hypothetical protein
MSDPATTPSTSLSLRILRSGTVASLLSTTALALLCRRKGLGAAAGTNATSHWLWGERAKGVRRFSLRHTLLGYATHHASSLFWAGLFERFCRGRECSSALYALPKALAVTATAAFVDYRLTPRRLRPGFEAHLSRKELAAVFLTFGVGLALSHVSAGIAQRSAGPDIRPGRLPLGAQRHGPAELAPQPGATLQ